MNPGAACGKRLEYQALLQLEGNKTALELARLCSTLQTQFMVLKSNLMQLINTFH